MFINVSNRIVLHLWLVSNKNSTIIPNQPIAGEPEEEFHRRFRANILLCATTLF
jgi:hypothetical protein